MADLHDYLQGLSEQSTRSDPLVFSGRQHEIGKVLRSSANPPPEGPRSRSILILGPPGSGKTSLISHLCKQLNASADVGVLFLEKIPSDESIPRVYGHIASMLIDADSPTRHGDTQKAIRGGRNLGIVVGNRTSSRRESFPTFHSSLDIAGERKRKWNPKRRLVVFVDEVQEVEPGGKAAAMLGDLHAQTKIPVFLVCAGLSNSGLALSDAGLSRMENKIHLGELSSLDANACATESLQTVLARGVAGSDAAVERWAAALARASDNWPRHLQVYLQATWLALLAQEKPHLDEADLDAVIESGDERRDIYYEERINASHSPLEIIASLHERLRAGSELSQSEARKVIGQVVDGLDRRTRAEWAERFDDNTEKCFAALLKAGVISLNEKYLCESPVPSFSRYILGSNGGESNRNTPVPSSGQKS